MKLFVLVALALCSGLAMTFAQSGPSHTSRLVSMSAWSRPSVVATHGVQMRTCVSGPGILSTGGPSVIMRFEPVPQATIQSLQQMAAAQQRVLAYTPRKITAAFVSVDVVGDTAPARVFKAHGTSDDPRALEVVLPEPNGGWYNQPLRIQSGVWSDDEVIVSSDATITLTP